MTNKDALKFYDENYNLEYRYCLQPAIEQDYEQIELERWIAFYDRETGAAVGGTNPEKIATFVKGQFELAALAAELFNNERELTEVVIDDD